MNKKVGLVLSGIVLSLGIAAVPVIAGTIPKTEIQANVSPSSVATRQNIKTVANPPSDIGSNKTTQDNKDTQGTPNNPKDSNYCNSQSSISSETMKNIHDSDVMQDAIKSGDINKMKDALNSPEVKAQLGEDVVNSMNEMMSNANINANAMHGAGAQGSGMMGGSSSMMGSGARNTVNWQ